MTLPDLEQLMPESDPGEATTQAAAAAPAAPAAAAAPAKSAGVRDPDDTIRGPEDRVSKVVAELLRGFADIDASSEIAPDEGGAAAPDAVAAAEQAQVVEMAPAQAAQPQQQQGAASAGAAEIHRLAAALLATGDPGDRIRARKLLDTIVPSMRDEAAVAQGAAQQPAQAASAAPPEPELPKEPDWNFRLDELRQEIATRMQEENSYIVEEQKTVFDETTGEERVVKSRVRKTDVDVSHPLVRELIETRAKLTLREEREAWAARVATIRSEWEATRAREAAAARAQAVLRSREEGLRAVEAALMSGKSLPVQPLSGAPDAKPVDLGALVASASDKRAMAVVLRNVILGAEASQEWQQAVERHVASGVPLEQLMRVNPSTGRSYYVDALLQFAMEAGIRQAFPAAAQGSTASASLAAATAQAQTAQAQTAQAQKPAVRPGAVMKTPPQIPGTAAPPPSPQRPGAVRVNPLGKPGALQEDGAPPPVKFPRVGASAEEVQEAIRTQLSNILL